MASAYAFAIAGVASLAVLGVNIPHAAAADAPSSYATTLATARSAAKTASSASGTAAATAAAAAKAVVSANAAVAKAQSAATSALDSEIRAEAALKAAKTSAAASQAQGVYNRSVAAKHAADAALGQAVTAARDRRIDASVATSRAATAATASAAAVERVTRLHTMYGTSPASAAFTKLKAAYTFSGTRPGKDWSVYNSAFTGKPYLRDPGYTSVFGNVLRVTSWGRVGSGLCLCGAKATPTAPFGRWEVRAKVNPNADHGVAILLWPNAGGWPKAGEIDLAEFDAARTKVAFAIHYDAKNLQKQTYVAGDYTTWHTFTVDWNSKGLAYYIDDKLICITVDKAVIPTAAMHLAMQAGPNSVSKATSTSTTLDVAWVRYFAA